jgi:Lipocalin-like domain
VSMLSKDLFGVWELERWETVVDDEIIGYPLGEEAFGLLIYHPGGFMSVNISSSTRVPIASNDPFEGDPQLLAVDAQGFLSYCGPFSIESEHEVIHHLKLCSFEDWVGTDQHRFAQLEGDTLTLSTAPRLLRGKQGVGRLVWKRVTTTG